jgi:hypothetical protein
MKLNWMKGLIAAVILAVGNPAEAQENNTPLEQVMDGLNARNIGPAGMSGRVTCVTVHPKNATTIYAGSASGGVWKSTNNGQSWTPLFQNERVASIGAIAIDPKHPDVIYVGTGEGNPRNSQTSGYGLYKSYDGGETWACLGLEDTRTIQPGTDRRGIRGCNRIGLGRWSSRCFQNHRWRKDLGKEFVFERESRGRGPSDGSE